MPRKRPEDDLQRKCVEILERVHPRYQGDVLWFHVPNGGGRSKVEAAIFKGLGVVAGVPDLVLIWGRGTLLVELKAPRGRLTKSQRKVFDQCDRMGVEYDQVNSVEGFLSACVEREVPGMDRVSL